MLRRTTIMPRRCLAACGRSLVSRQAFGRVELWHLVLVRCYILQYQRIFVLFLVSFHRLSVADGGMVEASDRSVQMPRCLNLAMTASVPYVCVRLGSMTFNIAVTRTVLFCLALRDAVYESILIRICDGCSLRDIAPLLRQTTIAFNMPCTMWFPIFFTVVFLALCIRWVGRLCLAAGRY